MKKIFMYAAAAALIGGLFCSCNKTDGPDSKALTVSFSTAAVTRASDTEATAGEVKLNTIDVLVFRSTSDAATGDGRLEVRRRANGAEVAAGAIRMEVNPGAKRIYVIANVPESLYEGIEDEAGLKAAWTRFAENATDSFVMAGTPKGESVLVAGQSEGNRVNVELRRLVARVKVEKISAEFSSIAVRNSDFRIRRVYMTYVPKRVKVVNGDVKDAFGTPHDATLSGRNYTGFYDYDIPVPGDDRLGLSEDGFHNPGVLRDGVVLIDKGLETMTCYTLEASDGYLYSSDASRALPDHAWEPDGKVYFYMYPNASPLSEDPAVYDYTTKLVIEAELNGEVFWYPIPMPYTQPNWAYTVNGIKLTTKGSDDPNLPVNSRQVDVDFTVRDWTTGEIIGSFNHPDDNNGFIF